jgi:hypothetical protein
MGWADAHIAKLKAGETVQFRPIGHSMRPRIENRQLCTVVPITKIVDIKVGDIVLCKVAGRQLVHLIKAISSMETIQIANNKGFVNGWIGVNAVYGKVIKVEP